MSRYKAVLFDIDGTVEDTTEFIHQAFEHVFTITNSPAIPRENINPLIGLPLKEIYERFPTGVPYESLRDMHNDFQMKRLDLIRGYDGIKHVLETLQKADIQLAAVSSRKREVLEATLSHSGLLQYFKTVIGPYDTPHHKPHPAPALLALERMNISPTDAIMIGDSYVDIETGKNAGTATMRVTYGFNTDKIDEPKPDHIAHTPHEILRFIM
ncbi:MAG: hypothetical protein RI911_827 [Candidatus Parcubacteria bacterium]|jgi:pyrophosphatase PpaX